MHFEVTGSGNQLKTTFNYAVDDSAHTRAACYAEIVIKGGIELQCSYFGSLLVISLFEAGSATLNSVAEQ
ncbi:MAG: hypothetical protein OFPII_00630 [Osedax symbiont Rs1]|nr:MAG: hypothetical protein OFPII_00630 [Osedax symbiont Rs1]